MRASDPTATTFGASPRLLALIQNASDLVTVVDAEGTIIYESPSVKRIFGYEPEEVVGTGMTDMIHPEDAEKVWSLFAEIASKPGVSPSVEVRARHRDGSWRHIEAVANNLLHDPNLRGIVVNSRDVTERKRAEEEIRQLNETLEWRVAERTSELEATTTDLERAQNELRGSEERNRLLVEGVREYAIFMLDPEGRIESWNLGAQRIKGYTREEILGRHFSCLYTEEDVERGHPAEELRLAREQGRYEEEGWRMRKDGSRFWASVLITALRDEEGRLQGFSKVMRDVTERMQAEAALRDYAEKLQRSNRELQDFANVASHDLQEPLRKVSSFSERLRTRYGDALGDQGLDYLRRMEGATVRMQGLIEDLLSLSRVTTQANPFEPVDLAVVVPEVLSDLEARLEETGGTVEVGALPTVEADRAQMRQLLQNLIGNALKFHDEGEPPVVKVYAEPEGRAANGGRMRCRLVIEDSGIGFDEEHLSRIFVPFERLHGRGAYEGSGMGLAICRKVVERHGGEITGESVPGQGARFITTLPMEQIEEVPIGKVES